MNVSQAHLPNRAAAAGCSPGRRGSWGVGETPEEVVAGLFSLSPCNSPVPAAPPHTHTQGHAWNFPSEATDQLSAAKEVLRVKSRSEGG